MIYLIRSRATKEQIDEMSETLEVYIKLAVDIQRDILAGGGVLHADCEALLIADGSDQHDIWGADWIQSTQEVRFEALINIRPLQNNPAMTILDPVIRDRVEEVTRRLLENI